MPIKMRRFVDAGCSHRNRQQSAELLRYASAMQRPKLFKGQIETRAANAKK